MHTRTAALIELSLALAAIWLVLGGYSLIDARLSLFGLALEKTAIADYVAPSEEVPLTPDPTLASVAPRPANSAPTARHVDARPQRILLFGDSMIDELLPRLADYCLQNGHSLHPAIWYGASSVDWSHSDKLDQLLIDFDPTFVIAVVGSNELTTQRIDRRQAAVRTILRKVGQRHFVWLGPPNWTKDSGINALLLRELGAERFFDTSRRVPMSVDERKADGIHPNSRASQRWLDAVAAWIATESAAPIALRLPNEHAPRPAARIFPPP